MTHTLRIEHGSSVRTSTHDTEAKAVASLNEYANMNGVRLNRGYLSQYRAECGHWHRVGLYTIT